MATVGIVLPDLVIAGYKIFRALLPRELIVAAALATFRLGHVPLSQAARFSRSRMLKAA
jgi:hypothetical protein